MELCPSESSFAVRLAESFIQNRETLTEAIVDSCPVPMFVANATGQWVFVNGVYTRLLCCDPAHLLDDNWLSTLAPASFANLDPLWKSAVKNQVSIQHLRVDHRQGRGGTVSGYMTINHVHPACFVGWFVPICCTPQDCPLHGLILKNVQYPMPLGSVLAASVNAKRPISSA